MHIIKGETEDFEEYAVVLPEKQGRVIFVTDDRLRGPYLVEEKEYAKVFDNVTEADDDSGLLVQHMADYQGNLIYTDGKAEIVIDNTARIIMLSPAYRLEFINAGYRPKTTVAYVPGIRIIRKRA